MKVMSFKDISRLDIAPAACVGWAEEALLMKDSILLPHKISLKPEGMPDVFYNTMPCIIPEIARAGVKVVTRYPKRNPSLDSEILLYDLKTGSCLALLDANWITTMRTGAVAAHTIRLLGKSNFQKIGMMGLGNTARATLLCLVDSMPEREFQIGLLRYKNQHEEFIERFSNAANVSFHVIDNPSCLAKESEVLVSCVTAATENYCDSKDFNPGCLVVPVHTRGFANCDLSFDSVFCDDERHVSNFKYYQVFKNKLTEVADVVSGKKPGRKNDKENIIVYNIGISLHDIFFAAKIHERLQGSAPEINLAKPDKKFWV